MTSGGWNLNWQGFCQNHADYPVAAGYPATDPPLAGVEEDDPMGDSLATLRPDPAPDEQEVLPDAQAPGNMVYEGAPYPLTVSSQHPSNISGTTSETSWELDYLRDSTMFDTDTGPPTQQRPNAHDLVHVASWNPDIPEIPDYIDLNDDSGYQPQPPDVYTGIPLQPQISHPSMLGLPDRGNPSRQTLQDHLACVNAHYQTVFAPSEGVPPLEDLVQTQQSLGHLKANVDALIQAQESLIPKNPSISTPSSIDRGPQKYQCHQCLQDGKPIAIFEKPGTFKRHVNEQHYPQYEYHCPVEGCAEIRFRKSKMNSHVTTTHKQFALRKQLVLGRVIDENTHERPVDSVCKLCPRAVKTWRDFYACYMSHCVITSPVQSRRSSDDRGSGMSLSGPSHNGGSSLAQAPANPPPPAYNGHGTNVGQSQSLSFQRTPSGQSYHLAVSAPLSRSVSDEFVRGSANNNASSSRVSRHNYLNRRFISGDNLPGALPVSRRLQPPRNAPRNQSNPNSGSQGPLCRGCGRLFDTCDICRARRFSGDRCCRCYSSSAVVQSSHPGPSQEQTMHYNNPGLGTSGPQPPVNPIYQGPGAPPGYGPHQAPQFQAPQFQGDFIQRLARFTGSSSASPRGSRYNVSAVTEIPEPVFSEDDMVYSLRESKIAQSAGSWISCLPMRIPLARGVIKPLQRLSSSLYGGTCVATWGNPCPAPVQASSPSFQCNCPCRTAAMLKEAYSGQAQAELAPGKQVKLDLKILSPEGRGAGHPAHLRTRVQLVVKLLKLRSSAAETLGKKQKEEAKLALEQALESTFDRSEQKVDEDADDSDVSETESVFDDDAASMSSSCSDISTLAHTRPGPPRMDDECSDESDQRYEEATELSFDFDLDSALATLSRWTGKLSEGVCSDLTTMDPSCVLEYFFKYIMYVMVVLSRSMDSGRGTHLEQ